MRTYELTAISMLAAIGAVLQIANNVIGYPTSFGMTIDLVGVPIILGFLLFGLAGGLYTSVLVSIVIAIVAQSSWLGASMKFAATLPMFLVPALYALYQHKGANNSARIAAPIFIGTFLSIGIFILAGRTQTPLNQLLGTNLLLGILPILLLSAFAFALAKIWGKNSAGITSSLFSKPAVAVTVLAIAILVRGISMLVSNYYYAAPIFWHITPAQAMAFAPWPLIFGWNAVQGALEFTIAWAIAYRFGLAKKHGTF